MTRTLLHLEAACSHLKTQSLVHVHSFLKKRIDRKKARQEAAQKAMSEARLKLKPVWDLLNDPQASFDSLSELLTKCNMTMKDYEDNVEALSTANLKPPKFPTYEQFYKCASVELPTHPGILIPVRAVVQAHKEKFEKHSEELDKALDQLQQQGPPENAWTAFAPEIKVDHLECIAEREDINPDDEDVQDEVPEYQILEHGDGVVPQGTAAQY
ncbi:hypothetical protein DPX16_23888 [Anabarilius grahami]|uniref:Uncharacterized protein n=1 Tax=Anabarilius grahami TaxID=495550 RepID=A0A3N0YH83_ANAGA|nr:hypothetical protein DPX16_23888 [Anabarilius grahami]